MSKSVKLLICLANVLLSSVLGFLLFYVFHPSCVISFSFVLILDLLHISIINFSILLHISSIMSLAPESSLEAGPCYTFPSILNVTTARYF
jgi:hypothetical protein